MSCYKGKKLTVDVFGSSHGDNVGVRIKGLPDTDIDEAFIKAFLNRRRPKSKLSTARVEDDSLVITRDGDCVVITIKNGDVRSSDYGELYGKPRPSHADYSAYLKDGTLDFAGGGRFSGRMTAPLVAAGALCVKFLETHGIKIAAYVSAAGSVFARSYSDGEPSVAEIEKTRGDTVPSLDKSDEIAAEISSAVEMGDSVGGQIECVAEGRLACLGNDLFDGLESKISALVFAIPAVKAVEFGLGTGFKDKRASTVNDQMFFDGDEVAFSSNNAGGICGGIADGRRITLRVTFKPTPSIAIPQRTVDLVNNTDCVIKASGRHDGCIVLRAVPAVESAVAIALTDEILNTFCLQGQTKSR